jgi:hypothetical protein
MTAQGHLDWVRDLVAARCPEVSEDEVVDAYSPPSSTLTPARIWTVIAERMIDALSALRGAFGPD